MSYPPHASVHSPRNPYTPQGGRPGPPRRNMALVGGIVVGCTALLLGSILMVAFVVNRGGGNAAAEDPAETTDGAEEAGIESGSNDPEEVAVTVAEILYGLSGEGSEGYVCADPSSALADVEQTGAIAAEMLGELSELLEGVTATGSSREGDAMLVDVAFIASGAQSPAGTVELVVEDGLWKACDFTY
ncbi:hypothetical protein L0U85_01325 [Glycomyces sp. L485]|uniref:hypothetical protein n=1 Tax=Glycomyces sp. L485 TaxID=2909235 RepID=UPI001F4AFAEB|nr:hypothetical protein [Glycomyces sp. L485]MCH7229508.1 hypothetical protein [Glycomyces sp. L485]